MSQFLTSSTKSKLGPKLKQTPVPPRTTTDRTVEPTLSPSQAKSVSRIITIAAKTTPALAAKKPMAALIRSSLSDSKTTAHVPSVFHVSAMPVATEKAYNATDLATEVS